MVEIPFHNWNLENQEADWCLRADVDDADWRQDRTRRQASALPLCQTRNQLTKTARRATGVKLTEDTCQATNARARPLCGDNITPSNKVNTVKASTAVNLPGEILYFLCAGQGRVHDWSTR